MCVVKLRIITYFTVVHLLSPSGPDKTINKSPCYHFYPIKLFPAVFDKDRSGFVTKKEFARAFTKLETTQVDAIFKKFDASNDGKLNFVEFKNFMSRYAFLIG